MSWGGSYKMENFKFTLNQKIAIGILCSLEVYTEPKYVAWANGWLEGKDRTKKSAADAYADADAAYATYAAYAAAADAAAAAAAADAYAAADAADALKRSIKVKFSINLFAIIEKVMSMGNL